MDKPDGSHERPFGSLGPDAPSGAQTFGRSGRVVVAARRRPRRAKIGLRRRAKFWPRSAGWAEDGARLVAPSLLAFELANVCLVKSRRHSDHREALFAGFGLRSRLGVEQMAVDHASIVELALETGLTAYDASYLWLARRFGAELVTLDKTLDPAASAT